MNILKPNEHVSGTQRFYSFQHFKESLIYSIQITKMATFFPPAFFIALRVKFFHSNINFDLNQVLPQATFLYKNLGPLNIVLVRRCGLLTDFPKTMPP